MSPNLLKSVVNNTQQGGRNFINYMLKGLFHNVGAEPVRGIGATMEMKLFGRNFAFATDTIRPAVGGMTEPMGLGSKLWAGGQVAAAVASVGMGFAEGGIPGAVKRLITDVGVDAAMVRHGYKSSVNAEGVTRFAHKGILSTLGRYGVGSTVAYGANEMLGGGILGMAGGLVGGNLGVRHAGKFAIAGAAYYGGKAVARGTYEVLKAGNQFYQNQKKIQTDGDMSAFMTSGAFNQRERAVQAIQRSHHNARSALGREASYLSSSRSYFSPYRQF